MDPETRSGGTAEARPPLAAVENVTNSTGKSAAESLRAVKAIDSETVSGEGKVPPKRHHEETGEVEWRDGERQERKETNGERQDEDIDVEVAATFCKKGKVESSKIELSKDTLENPRDADASCNSTVHSKDSEASGLKTSPDERESVSKTSNESQCEDPVIKMNMEKEHANEDTDDNTDERITHKELTDKESATSEGQISSMLVENSETAKNEVTVESKISEKVMDHDAKSLSSEDDSVKVRDPDSTSQEKGRDHGDLEQVRDKYPTSQRKVTDSGESDQEPAPASLSTISTHGAAVDIVNVPVMVNSAITISRAEQEQAIGNQEPVKDAKAPAKDEKPSAEDKKSSAKIEQPPAREELASARDEAAPSKDEVAPAREEVAPAREEPASARDEAAPTRDEGAGAYAAPPRVEIPDSVRRHLTLTQHAMLSHINTMVERSQARDEAAPTRDEAAGAYAAPPRVEIPFLQRNLTLTQQTTLSHINTMVERSRQERLAMLTQWVQRRPPPDPRKLLAKYTAEALNMLHPTTVSLYYNVDTHSLPALASLINRMEVLSRQQPHWEFASRLREGIDLLEVWRIESSPYAVSELSPRLTALRANLAATATPCSRPCCQPRPGVVLPSNYVMAAQAQDNAISHFKPLAEALGVKEVMFVGWFVEEDKQLGGGGGDDDGDDAL